MSEKPRRIPRILQIVQVVVLLSLSLLTLAGLGPAARAQQPADGVRAQELAEEAVRASREGDLEAAIEKYRLALALAPELGGARFALARLLAGLSRFEEARAEFATLVAANPADGLSRRGEVTALLLLGRWAEARQRLEDGLTALPQDGQLAHLLARVLASAPLDSVRDGGLALDLAVMVYQVQPIPQVGETIAMGFAESGEFDKAIRFQRRLVDDVEASGGDESQLAGMRDRLAAYIRQEAWRAVSPMEIVMSTELPATKPGE